MLPWLEQNVEEVVQVMEENYWPYGVKATRHVISKFLDYMYNLRNSAEVIDT